MRLEVLGGVVEIDESRLDASPPAISRQVAAYERGDRRSFDLHLTIPDSFTGEVLAAISRIPFGETRTYGDLAADLDTAPIAVGTACGRNPVPIIVPCHRVVGSDGALRGYSAPGGVALKRRLLTHESRVKAANRGRGTGTGKPR